eukprot:SAG22_NODE_1815_length_3518_cov_3.123720_2_plen_223_part_00
MVTGGHLGQHELIENYQEHIDTLGGWLLATLEGRKPSGKPLEAYFAESIDKVRKVTAEFTSDSNCINHFVLSARNGASRWTAEIKATGLEILVDQCRREREGNPDKTAKEDTEEFLRNTGHPDETEVLNKKLQIVFDGKPIDLFEKELPPAAAYLAFAGARSDDDEPPEFQVVPYETLALKPQELVEKYLDDPELSAPVKPGEGAAEAEHRRLEPERKKSRQ